MQYSKTITIGILAHVDAGKTTITENMLFNAGVIRNLGNVDKGSTVTDNMTLEKERGISIKSAATSFTWKDTKINIIDTPGHADFSSEVSRSLTAIDVAILVISCVEGVQAHTLTLVESIKKRKIPVFIFVNKIDRQGADFELVLKQIKKELKYTPIPITSCKDEGLNEADITHILHNDSFPYEQKQQLYEELITEKEALLEDYLEGNTIPDDKLSAAIIEETNNQTITPLYCGIAKNNIGIHELLDGITSFVKVKNSTEEEVSAFVFKLTHHDTQGVQAFVKVVSGTIHSKSSIFNHTQRLETKINQTKVFNGTKLVDAPIKAGDIGLLSGILDTKAGDILGNPELIPTSSIVGIPVLSVQVTPNNNADYNKLVHSLQLMDKEDPSLQLKWHKAEKELLLLLMGDMQNEVIQHTLENRFNIPVTISPPNILYKETISHKAEGYIRYWMPKPCWAIMTFLIEPGDLNSGIQYTSNVSKNDIHNKYQNEIEQTVPKALEQGLKGWQVTDVKVSLISGEDHNVHTKPGDFNLATPMGIMKALQNGGTHLLEPVLKFEINTNETFLGKVTSELIARRATLDAPTFDENNVLISGLVPVATSLDLSIKLNNICSGKIRLRTVFHSYQPCPEGEGKIREYKGVNPLDEAQWILHRRGAYKANERII